MMRRFLARDKRGSWATPMRATLHLPVTRRIKVVRTTEWGNPGRTKQLAAFGFTGHRPPATLPQPVGHRATSAFCSSPPGNFGFVSAPPPRPFLT